MLKFENDEVDLNEILRAAEGMGMGIGMGGGRNCVTAACREHSTYPVIVESKAGWLMCCYFVVASFKRTCLFMCRVPCPF